jgi:hypothetical protein
MRYFRALWWVMAFVVLGTVFLVLSGQQLVGGVLDAAFYSLDELLPIVHLDKRYEDIKPTGFVKYYFYLHKLSGWALGSFLVAGLAGLTLSHPLIFSYNISIG